MACLRACIQIALDVQRQCSQKWWAPEKMKMIMHRDNKSYVPFIYSVNAGSRVFSYVHNRIRLRPGVLTFDRIKAKVRDESG